MNLVFFGTPDLSAYVLNELYLKGFKIKAVVTQPDRKSGRGLQISAPAVKELAVKQGLKVLQSERFDKKLFSEIKDLGKIDICVVVAYGCYIPTYFIDHMGGKILNIHFSLLPRYRGAAPVARAIMNGDDFCGVSIMEISKAMDEGAVLAQSKIKIKDNDDTSSLSWKLVKEGVPLLIDTIPGYLEGSINKIPQIQMNEQPSYAPKISSEEKRIDWKNSAVEIWNQTRALYPWPVAESVIEGSIIKFINVRPVNETKDDPLFEVGAVTSVDKKEGFFTVKTGKGLLLVEKVKPSGKKEMSVSDFLNGYKLKPGMRFSDV